MKPIKTTIEDKDYQRAVQLAEADRRSIADWLRGLVLKEVRKEEL